MSQTTSKSWGDEVEAAEAANAAAPSSSSSTPSTPASNPEALADKLSSVSIAKDAPAPAHASTAAHGTGAINFGAKDGPAKIDWTGEVEVQQANPNSPLFSVQSFEQLNLRPELLQGVYAMKFNKPSKIQEKALPLILADPPTNLIAQSQSGTGKTAAFSLGMLSRVNESNKFPQAICLSPTRELARQTGDVIKEMGKFTKLEVLIALKDMEVQKGQLLQQQIIIGTPGTIIALLKNRCFDPRKIVAFVLDEADNLLDQQGMVDQTLLIKQSLSPSVQCLFFSATFSPQVMELANKVAKNANTIRLKREELSLDGIKQYWIDCKDDETRYRALSDIYGLVNLGQVIIFCHTRDGVQKLAERMRKDGHTLSIIHGKDMESSERDRVIDDFRDGKTKVLIATNVLARGIDVLQVNVVINYDLPQTVNGQPDFETYLHRIGRTGRFGRKGVGINFVYDKRSRDIIDAFEKFFKREIKRIPTDDPEKMEEMLKIN